MGGRKMTRRATVGMVGLAVVAALVVAFLPAELELVISPVGGGEPILVAPLAPGERFTLHYIHSVDRAPIWETHSADRWGNIYIEEERFIFFGAGMGHWRGHGTLTQRDGCQVIENIHAPVGDFVLRVGGQGVNHAIIWRDSRVSLSEIAAGQAVRVRAAPRSLAHRLWRRLVPHPVTPKRSEP